MAAIELRPVNGGKPIVSSNAASLLYLLGQNGSFHWADHLESGALPILIAAQTRGGVYFAPLHPMCHLGSHEGAVVRKRNGDTIQIGVTAMTVHLRHSRRIAMVSVLMVLIFVSGWCARSFIQSDSPTSSQSQEESYVF